MTCLGPAVVTLESRQAPEVTSGEGRQKVADVDTSFEDEAERFKRTSAVRTPTRALRHLQTHICLPPDTLRHP